MALGRTVRALLEVHVLTAVNSGLRNAGLGVALFALVVLALVYGAFSLMVFVLAFSGGLGLAPMVADGRTGLAGLAFTAAVVLGPFLSVMGGDGRELEWERFRLYPVTGLALFLSELIAMVGNPIMAVFALGEVVLAAGLVWREPSLWPVALSTALACVVAQAALRLVLASFATRLLQRLRTVAVVLIILLPLPFVFLAERVQEARESKDGLAQLDQLHDRVTAWLTTGESAISALPASVVLRLPVAVKTGDWAEVARGTAAPALLLVLLVVLAVRSVLSEGTATSRASSSAPERLWTFRRPEWGIARLQLISLFDSQLGRVGLVLPFSWFIPAWLISRFEPAAPTHVLSLFAWVLVPTGTTAILFNQFGLDRGAVKGLFLLPISDLAVLRGKALGLAVYQALQLVLVGLATAVLMRPPGYVLLGGPLVAAWVFVTQLTVGQWTSTIWPRPIPRKTMRQPQAGFLFALVSLSAMAATMTPVSVLWLVLAPTAPWALPPAVAALVLLAWLVQRRFSREAARMLALRRERIVESLS